MTCPRCGAAMAVHTLDSRSGAAVEIDCCFPCQAFWFDGRESLSLTPGSTLALFRVIGEHTARPARGGLELAKCPRCRAHLRRVRDLQRTTRFEYYACPNRHGRLITFFDFLKEKDFIKPLSPQQIAGLARTIQMVNCSNCGAPIDLTRTTACAHCGSPLSMLDMHQAERLIDQLRQRDRPAPQVEVIPADDVWLRDASSLGVFNASLTALARFLRASRI